MAEQIYDESNVVKVCPLYIQFTFNETTYLYKKLKAKHDKKLKAKHDKSTEIPKEQFGGHRTSIPKQEGEYCWTFAVWQLCATTVLWNRVTPFQYIIASLTFESVKVSKSVPIEALLLNYLSEVTMHWEEDEAKRRILSDYGHADCFLSAVLKCSDINVDMKNMVTFSEPSNISLVGGDGESGNREPSRHVVANLGGEFDEARSNSSPKVRDVVAKFDQLATSPPSSQTIRIHRFETEKGSNHNIDGIKNVLEGLSILGGIIHVARKTITTETPDSKEQKEEVEFVEHHFVSFSKHDSELYFYDTNHSTYEESLQSECWKERIILHIYLVSM